MSSKRQSLYFEVQQAIIAKSASWLILVCPDLDTMKEVSESLVLFFRSEGSFSGRTRLYDKGKISVTLAMSPVFIPEDSSFEITCIGWSNPQNIDELKEWIRASKENFDD